MVAFQSSAMVPISPEMTYARVGWLVGWLVGYHAGYTEDLPFLSPRTDLINLEKSKVFYMTASGSGCIFTGKDKFSGVS